MSVEATFYTLRHPIPDSLYSALKRAPGVESLEPIPQNELHEHLVGFLGFVSAVTEGGQDERVMALMQFILSIGEALDFRFEESALGNASQLRIREQLSAFGGVWLAADGVFDVDGRLILGNDGQTDEAALLPDLPESRLQNAEFIYGALERERDQQDQGEPPSSANLTARPLDELHRMVDLGRTKAESYGLTDPDDQFAFVSVMFEIGPNFDDHPEIRKVLTDESIPPGERLEACVDHPDGERIWSEVEDMIDLTKWTTGHNVM